MMNGNAAGESGTGGNGKNAFSSEQQKRTLGDAIGESAGVSAQPSMAEALGQIAWLFSQSPLHRELKIKDLEWSILPALLEGQFRLFNFGPMPGLDAKQAEALAPIGLSKQALERLPLGVAIWAKLSEDAEARLDRGERMRAEDWQSGDRLWLIELISPFATAENKLSHAMMFDLMQGPFKNTPFNLHRTDPAGVRTKVCMTAHLVQ
jgi:cytolysin-activating lysine-acyltransferase